VEKIHNEQLYNLYYSPNIIRVIKTRMRWAGHVARMGRGELHTGFWWRNFYKEATCETWRGWAYTIRMNLPIGGYELWPGFICFGTGTGSGRLWMR